LRRLAESCPAEIGDEIAVTGSVALGLAEKRSDIELKLW
jgi:predicted nucleotidyltransferase